MSFAELAQARGISKLSAAALVRRHHWRRMKDNHGRVLALVPHDGPELRRSERNQADDQPAQSDRQPDDRTDLAEQRADRADQRADEAHRRADVALVLADRALAQLADAEGEARDLRAELDAAKADFRELRTHAAALQVQLAGQTEVLQRLQALEAAEAERKARGLLARLRAALRRSRDGGGG
jgi:hypothetical protein